ncbi:GNAT family N-acetyltransferase [Bacillus taeanensis]|uniref:N-acetyltransferase n=1 Tax=Bacillus taeanensis TaxID=273032 RepID=A0A366XX05_9BACI|nr:GNAT family N-acetyltransferase [Bacillus taeanensis]RBW68673.1 N-acetyltransferase [Bacillus taeanensis]
MNLLFRKVEEQDWHRIRDIYKQGIESGQATFETKVPSWEKWISSKKAECTVAAHTDENIIIGWASVSPVSHREVYRGVGEVSVYVDADYKGIGVGSALLHQLIQLSEKHTYWTLQAGILEGNEASIVLHQKHGFRIVGRREQIGKLNGRWIDVLLLERRSKVVGVEDADFAKGHFH